MHRLDLGLYSHPKELGGGGGGSSLPGKKSSEEDGTHNAASSRTASPTHYQLSYSGPRQDLIVCASRAEDPGFESRLRRDFSGVESYQ